MRGDPGKGIWNSLGYNLDTLCPLRGRRIQELRAFRLASSEAWVMGGWEAGRDSEVAGGDLDGSGGDLEGSGCDSEGFGGELEGFGCDLEGFEVI